MRRPSTNASATGVAAPGTSVWSHRQALRCSSDRKKFRTVQSEVQTFWGSIPRSPTHTMMPSAPRPGPVPSTGKSSGAAQWWHRERIAAGWPTIGGMPRASIAQQA
jgi:hypothetical protein